MNAKNQEPMRQLVESSGDAAPALLGAAAGILLADLMHERARRPVAFSLVCLGVAALAPSLVGVVRDKVAGPETRRGTQRTLRKIREGSGVPPQNVAYVEEEQLFVG